VNGYWAPGLLYFDVSAPPHVMELDFLTGSSEPHSEAAKLMMARYSTFLRAALAKKGFDWNELTQATIKFQFSAKVPDPYFAYPCAGAPFICDVTLTTVHGHMATASAKARCNPYRPGLLLSVRQFLSRSRAP
jgi:hypothetical protein